MDALTTVAHVRDRNYVIAVRGQIDHETAPSLRDAIKDALLDHEHRQHHAVVDLREIATLDSAALAALMSAKREAEAIGRGLWLLLKPGSSPDRILTAANLLNHLSVVYEIDAYGPKPRAHGRQRLVRFEPSR